MKNAIVTILDEGGLTLWALLVLAVMIYSLIFAVWHRGRELRRLVATGAWKHSVHDAERETNLTRREWTRRYATFELDRCAWIERRLPFLGVLVAAAPLLGLLGTVAGMLVTFGGMAGAGNAAPFETISMGISRALVTTEAGLIIAIPGACLLALLMRQTESLHLELQRQLHEEQKVALSLASEAADDSDLLRSDLARQAALDSLYEENESLREMTPTSA